MNADHNAVLQRPVTNLDDYRHFRVAFEQICADNNVSVADKDVLRNTVGAKNYREILKELKSRCLSIKPSGKDANTISPLVQVAMSSPAVWNALTQMATRVEADLDAKRAKAKKAPTVAWYELTRHQNIPDDVLVRVYGEISTSESFVRAMKELATMRQSFVLRAAYVRLASGSVSENFHPERDWEKFWAQPPRPDRPNVRESVDANLLSYFKPSRGDPYDERLFGDFVKTQETRSLAPLLAASKAPVKKRRQVEEGESEEHLSPRKRRTPETLTGAGGSSDAESVESAEDGQGTVGKLSSKYPFAAFDAPSSVSSVEWIGCKADLLSERGSVPIFRHHFVRPSGSVALVVADPPYGLNVADWDRQVPATQWTFFWQTIAANFPKATPTFVAVFHNHIDGGALAGAASDVGFFAQQAVWVKPNATNRG